MKKILISVIFFSLIMQNSFGSTLILQETKDNVMYKKYEVSEEEKESFYSSLEDIINVNSCEYKKVECNIKGGSEEDTIEIEDTQEIITKSNSLTEILRYLPKELEYSKDGYIGTSNLNINDIKVTEIYNGYYEEYVEETKQYFDLPKNDMVYIPKEIEKDGITLYLINVEWYTQTTKKTGEIEIADLYRGEAYYKGVKKINNPSSYKIVAGYTGKATKKIENPYVFIVKYEEIIKEKQNIVLPITVGTISSIIVVVVLFFNKRNVRVFNLQYGKYKYLGKLKIKKLVLNLDNINKKAIGDKYKFVLNNYLLKKYKNCNIEVKKGNVSKTICINKKDLEIKM